MNLAPSAMARPQRVEVQLDPLGERRVDDCAELPSGPIVVSYPVYRVVDSDDTRAPSVDHRREIEADGEALAVIFVNAGSQVANIITHVAFRNRLAS